MSAVGFGRMSFMENRDVDENRREGGSENFILAVVGVHEFLVRWGVGTREDRLVPASAGCLINGRVFCDWCIRRRLKVVGTVDTGGGASH